MNNKIDILNKVSYVVKKAGKLIVKNDRPLNIEEKSSFKDLVTSLDKRIENLCITELSIWFPNAKFFTEENERCSELHEGMVFIIDPIDGTTNFVHEIQYCAVSIACCINGEIVLGVVYNPYSDELFTALSGYGAFLNGTSINVTTDCIHHTVVAFGTSPYNTERAASTFQMLQRLYYKCQDIRRFGAASLDICQVAAGRVGMFFEERLSLWDYAAAGLIVKEAGGVLLTLSGQKVLLSADKTSIVAGPISIIDESEIIRGLV